MLNNKTWPNKKMDVIIPIPENMVCNQVWNMIISNKSIWTCGAYKCWAIQSSFSHFDSLTTVMCPKGYCEEAARLLSYMGPFINHIQNWAHSRLFIQRPIYIPTFQGSHSIVYTNIHPQHPCLIVELCRTGFYQVRCTLISI